MPADLGTDADVQARAGGVAAFVRLFDRDRNGAVDTELLTAAKDYATAEVYGSLAASHPGVVFDAPGPVPVLIKHVWCSLVIAWMGEAMPGFTDAQRAPYAGMRKSAMQTLERLATNNKAQLPSGAPEPFADASGLVTAPSATFGDMANDPNDPGGSGRFSGF